MWSRATRPRWANSDSATAIYFSAFFDDPRMTSCELSDLLELSDLEESSDFDLPSFLEDESPLEELEEEEMERKTSWRSR